MSKELVIASNRQETKVAILEDDQLVEVYFQRSNEYSLAGSIHKGRVTRVLPGMQSAFVDLGLERDTFLYVSDFFEENEDIDTVSEEKSPRRERQGRRDRGDRGDRDRGDRDQGERQPVAARPVDASAAPRESAISREEATAVALPDESAVHLDDGPTLEAGRPAENQGFRPEARQENGDRNRGGDRRGRRSRRRRSRGQGFPENKYAQPSATESESSAVAEADSGEDEGEEPTPIILPGESLAKYKHSEPIPAPGYGYSAAPEPDVVSGLEYEGIQDAAEATALQEADEAAAIRERADELEAADLILSHNNDERSEAVEEKLTQIEHEQPVSPFVVNDIETVEDEPLPIVAEVREIAPVEPLRLSLPETETREETNTPEILQEENGIGAGELAEERAFAAEAAEYAAEGEFEGADLEDAQGGDAELAESLAEGLETSAGEEDPNAPRSASVREQGGRSMHRVSRRMRRRRGGNRFGQQGQPREEAPQFEAAGAAAAAVPVQAEVRRESGRDQVREQESRTEKTERVLPSITDLLKPGQELIVQIAKEPLGQKGARITSHVALPGRYVVFMPSVSHLGVSRKVESDEERQRLKRILQAHRVGTTGGFIVRTAGEGVPEEEIAADMDFLYKLWLDIRQKAEKRPAPMLLHCDLDVVQRILRDHVTEEYKAIWVDNEEMYESVLSFVQRFQPNLVGRVKMYTREAPIFDAFNITQELEKAIRPKVWLKSGGYIVINQTEALVAIDINTGKYVGKSNRLEDTIVKTNTEAVKEIVRQIRLRDLGGIIVVDFIDMDERKNRQKVMQALEEAMQTDKAPYKILQFNDFGLVAITRKRVKQSLERTLCAPCPYCEGAGYVKSVQTIIGEILVEAHKIRKALDRSDVLLRVHPDVAKVLKANDNRYLEELEETLARPVLVKGDPALHHEKFDLG